MVAGLLNGISNSTLALVGVLLVAGCSQTSAVLPDATAVEAAIESDVRAGDGASVDVTCKSTPTPDSASEMECVVRAGGEEEAVVAYSLDGTIEWDWSSNASLASAYLNMIKVKEDIRADLESQLSTGGLTVTCPRNVPRAAGATFECKVSDEVGTKRTVVIRQQDDQGAVTWALTP